MLIDSSGNIIEADSNYSFLIEYPADELLKMSIYILSVMGFGQQLREHLDKAKINGSAQFDIEQITKSGKIILVSINAVYLKSYNNFCLSINEIKNQSQIESNLRESYRRLNFHISNIPLATIEFNGDYQITKWSENAKKIFGWVKEEVLGKKISELKWIYEEDADEIAELSKEMMNGKQTSNVHINRNYRKDGSVIICQWNNSAALSPYGKLLSVFSFVQDITENKKIEKELKSLNSMKDKVFSIIAHDLKSPFMGIIGYTNMLSEHYDMLTDDERLSMIKKTEQLSINSNKLLNKLLDWSRLQMNKFNFEFVRFNLLEELEMTILLEKQIATRKNIEINYSINDSIYINADKNSLGIIIQNLIENAIKFTNPGGRITIDANVNDTHARIAVTDNGVGIDNEHLKKIFTMETGISRLGTAEEKGTGLGLLLCKEIVNKLNGEIWVESSEGKGSTFYFTLPLA